MGREEAGGCEGHRGTGDEEQGRRRERSRVREGSGVRERSGVGEIEREIERRREGRGGERTETEKWERVG